MSKEIDILKKAFATNCAVVEKTTNCLWTEEEVEHASANLRFQQEDALQSPDNQFAVTSLYPGCPQQHGASGAENHYTAVGQTTHFVIFQSTD